MQRSNQSGANWSTFSTGKFEAYIGDTESPTSRNRGCILNRFLRYRTTAPYVPAASITISPAVKTTAIAVSDEAPSSDEESSSCSDPGGSATTMVGTDNTVTPSAAEASAAVPRVEESEVCTAAAVVEAGTAMVAVMSTLAAATVTVTAEASTLPTFAIEVRSEVFLVS